MRIIPLVASAAILILMPGKAQQKASEGLACFENLATPDYPKAALRAYIGGSVWTTTNVNPQGGVDRIETQVVSAWGDGPKLLTPPVEKAIRSAKVKPECAGKAVSVVFRYSLHGDAIPNPTVTSRTDSPNRLWIESQPASAPEQR
jgi:hypothetical protein